MLLPSVLPGAPTNTLGPTTATPAPNRSPERPSAGVNVACSAHPEEPRTYTYAPPDTVAPVGREGSPTTAVDPESASDDPKRVVFAPSLADNFCS